MTTGQKIKRLREALKMTQTELADKVKTSKQTIYKYENNIITNIPSDRIELMAKTLGTTPAYLMGWDKTNQISDAQEVTDAYEKADTTIKNCVRAILKLPDLEDKDMECGEEEETS